MPRIIIDHSANIPSPGQDLFHVIHEYFVSTGRFSIEDLKSRSNSYENYRVADGATENAFISIHLRIMGGREEEFRMSLSKAVLEIARNYYGNTLSDLNCNLTCFVSEIDPGAYSKS